MSEFKIRGIGEGGVVTDINAYNLENPATVTRGVNVRFRDGKVSRGPLPKTVVDLQDKDPSHILSIPASAGDTEDIIIVTQNAEEFLRINGTNFEDVTPVDWIPISGNNQVTSTSLGGVSYVTRFTHHPVFIGPGGSRFERIPGWPEFDRAAKIVAYRDQLVAIGVQKQGAIFPTLVRWSDLSFFGQPPQSWDPADPTNSAGENILSEMKTPIMDAAVLQRSLMLYTQDSVWRMTFNGGPSIYNFDKQFDARGAMGLNCVVEVDNQHYVFDRNDIYVTDGISAKSICSQRVRNFIFNSIDFNQAHLCFVAYDPNRSEVRFHYPSDDVLVGFPRPTGGCNRAAVYHISSDTWTFYDLPNVVYSTFSAIQSGETWNDWEEAGYTWDTSGGLWSTSEGDSFRHFLYAGRKNEDQGLSANRIYGFEPADGRLPQSPELEAVKPAYIERQGIDLDVSNKPLRQYIRITYVWPQMSIDNPSDAYFQFGANDLVNREPMWTDRITHDPEAIDFIDINEGGKYLAWRFVCGGIGDFELSSMDVTLQPGGRR